MKCSLICVSTCYLALLVLAFGATFSHGQTKQAAPPSIESELEDALAERTTDAAARLALVARIDQQLVASGIDPSQSLNELQIKVRFVEALANMRLNNLELSAAQIASLREKVDERLFPELAFRCRSLQAAIMFSQGKKKESLAALESLLASDLSAVSDVLIDRARINYACVLEQCGRFDEAIGHFQSIMLGAIEHGNDSAALQAGNSMLHILLSGENLHAAREAVNELKPVMARNPETLGTKSVYLRELALMRLEGRNAEAIHALNEFIKSPLPPLLLGSAHHLLAHALAANGQLDDAIQHAQKAIELFDKLSNQLSARVTLSELFLKKQDFEAALAEANKIELPDPPEPVVQRRLYKVQLLAKLQQSGQAAEADMLSTLLDEVKAKDKHLSKFIAEDFQRQLSQVKQTLATKQMDALARADSESRRADRYRQYLVIGLLTAGSVGGCIMIVINLRRRAERLKLAEKIEQNSRLEALVESKTSELKANLEAQAEMAQALERKKRVETIGLLAGNVAHDINNLLQVIAAANETLASPNSDDQLRRQALSVSDESLRHGSGIIRQILAYSRQQELSARPVRVSDYLNNSRALFHSAVGATIDLSLDDQSRGVHILVDPSHLTTAILNILSNAADAMPGGGSVHIKAEPYVRDTAENSVWNNCKPGEYLLLSIRDSGCGMNTETLSRAFEPFYSTKCVGEGTGLGLSSVYGFVKQSGGDVRIVSQPGEGTQVQILFPVTTQPSGRTANPKNEAVEPFANKRLLLVEDHQAVARSLMLLLTHLKLQATWVASGDEAAVALTQDGAYDFVLSDVHMPGKMDGLSLARWIRANHPSIRVFLMSGYNDLPVDKIEVPLLQKPFKLTELSKLLSQDFASGAPAS